MLLEDNVEMGMLYLIKSDAHHTLFVFSGEVMEMTKAEVRQDGDLLC